MENSQPQSNEKVMGLSKFKESLETLNPFAALQNFKDLIDQAVGVGLFKKSEQIMILFRSIEVLNSLVVSAPTEPKDKKEDEPTQ